MIILRVFVLTLATSTVLAQTDNSTRPVRTPQAAQLNYDDPSGSKVNWKFYGPYNQPHTHLDENPQRTQRAEAAAVPAHAQIPAAGQRFVQSHQRQQPSPISNLVSTQPEYKPYASVPTQIKELILQTYEPQRPYVDPSSFIYHQNEPTRQYEAPATRYQTIDDTRPASTNSYHGEEGFDKSQGRIDYKQDYDQHIQQQQQQEQQAQHQQQVLQHQRQLEQQQVFQHQQQLEQQQALQHQPQEQQQQQIIGITIPIETMPVQPIPKLVIDKSMPQEIQQLLHYQAKIPYDVIANRITYRPKTLFIPKPIPDDSKGSYYYKSKIYFMKDDNVDEIGDAKPVEESQQHH